MSEESEEEIKKVALYLTAKYGKDKMFGPKTAWIIAKYAIREGWVKPGQKLTINNTQLF